MTYIIYGAALALVGWMLWDMRTPVKESIQADQLESDPDVDLFLATYWAEHPDEKPH